jgi:hypothetical protein
MSVDVNDVLVDVSDLPETATLADVIRYLNAQHEINARPSRVRNWNIGGVDSNGEWHYWAELTEDQWPPEHRAEIIAERDSWTAKCREYEVQ